MLRSRNRSSARLALALLAFLASAIAFAPLQQSRSRATADSGFNQGSQRSQTVAMFEKRTWNFNEGQSPWGMKKNAEVWNGRAAMVSLMSSKRTGRYRLADNPLIVDPNSSFPVTG